MGFNPAAVKHEHEDPARWYSVARARAMPTTLIIKARKPLSQTFRIRSGLTPYAARRRDLAAL